MKASVSSRPMLEVMVWPISKIARNSAVRLQGQNHTVEHAARWPSSSPRALTWLSRPGSYGLSASISAAVVARLRIGRDMVRAVPSEATTASMPIPTAIQNRLDPLLVDGLQEDLLGQIDDDEEQARIAAAPARRDL